MADRARSVAGKYAVDRRIDGTAVFETFAATAADGTPVVVRRLVPALAAREDVAQVFLDEARIAATFDHRNLVPVLEVGEDEKGPFAIVKRGPGFDLRHVLQFAGRRSKVVPVPVAAHLVGSIARGLQHVHERNDADGWPLGLLHGAVAPVVVHVGMDGVVRLDEFGHTRIAAAARASDPATLADRLPYVTPEQLCSAPLDLRSDLFSAGVILYELTTGRRPFAGSTANELMARIVECYPEPPVSFVPRYPADLERVVLRSLARIPDERYQTSVGFAKALADFLERADVSADDEAVATFMRGLGIPSAAEAAAAAVARVAGTGRSRVEFAAPPPSTPANERTGGSIKAPPPPPPMRIANKMPLPQIESADPVATVPRSTPDAAETGSGRIEASSEALRLAQERMATIRAEAEAAAREAEAEAAAVRRESEQRQAVEAREAEEELRSAVAAAAGARQEALRLTSEVAELHEAIDRLGESLREEEEGRRAAETELVRARARLREAEASARTSSEDARDREETGRATAERLAVLRRDLDEASTRETALRREIKDLVGREAEARQELKKTALRLATARRESDESAEAKEEARRDVAAASARENEARSMAAAAATREASARAEADGSRREADASRAEAREVRERLDEAEAAVKTLRGELENAKLQAEVFRRDAESFRSKAQTASNELDVRQLEAQRLARELSEREVALTEKESAARREVAASLQRESVARKAAEAAQVREAAALADADAAEARAESAERLADSARKDAAELRKAAEEAAKELETRRSSRLAELEEHERERETWLAREADLVKREASARMESERLAGEVDTRAGQVAVLDGELAVVTRDANVIRADRDSARTALQASRVALEELREELARVGDDFAAAKSVAERARRETASIRSERGSASARAAEAERERNVAREEMESVLEKLAAEQRERQAAERDAESARRLAGVAGEEALAAKRIAEEASVETEEIRQELEEARRDLIEYARRGVVPQEEEDPRNVKTVHGPDVESDPVEDEAPYADESTDPVAAAEATTTTTEESGIPSDTLKITFPEVALYLSSLAELPRSNITSDPTAFVGREPELRALGGFLQGDRPIMTLVGTPGSGRSRLALRFAASRLVELAPAGGAFHVDLSRARDGEGICTAIAHALAIRLVPSQPLSEVMKHLGLGLGGRGRLLLVLDDVDAVSAALSDLLTRWLPLAPQTRFLLVGREVVGAPGELRLEVGRMRMPGDGGDSQEEDGRSLRHFDAVQLYAARMRERRREAALAETGLDVIAGIVKALGGYPLAIELAAHREDPPQRLLRGLSQWAKDHPPVDAETEVEMTLAWAWSLLTPPERRVLTLCSPLARPFSVDAVRELAGGGDSDASGVLDVVRSLRGKGLLRTGDVPGLPDEPRLDMHPVTRHWLLEHHPVDAVMQERHDLRAIRVGRELAREAESAQDALRRLELEAPGLEEALSNAIDASERERAGRPKADQARIDGQGLALHALLGLAPWVEANPPFARFLSLADQALASAPDGIESRLHAEVLLFRGRARRAHGQLKGSLADLELADGLATSGADRKFEVDTATELALTRQALGDREGARRRLDGALATARRAKDERREAAIHGALAEVFRATGDLTAARASYEAAISLYRTIGNRRLEGEMLGCLGALLREQGDLKAAHAFLERALAMHKEVRDRTFEARAVGELAAAHLEKERFPAGRDLFLRAIQLHAETGNRHAEAVTRAQLGILEHLDGRHDESRAAFVRAMWILGDVGDRKMEAVYLAFLAALESARGALDVASQSADLAKRRLAGVDDPWATAAVEILGGVVDLARSRRAADSESARPLLESAKRRLAVAEATLSAPEVLRLARLVLRRAFTSGDPHSARSTG